MKKVSATSYLVVLIVFLLSCEGEVGPAGVDSLLNTTNELPGVNCAVGGLKVETGGDSNKNGVLEPGEVRSTKYICMGQNSLIKTTTENAGSNCPEGGLKIEAGMDADTSGTLEKQEVSSTQFICSAAGLNSLVNSSLVTVGEGCDNGGVRLDVGTDTNRDGVLQAAEIQSTRIVCNGINGLNTLVNSSPLAAGSECSNGGLKLDAGIDINSDGVLDDGEIQSIRYVCNGADGLSVNQVRFQLVSLTGLGSASMTGELAPSWMYLKKFRKNDFTRMRSAVLYANLSTESSTASSSVCTVEIFNLTDNVAISGSEATTDSEGRVWVESANFWNAIPNKEVDLAIRIRTSARGGFANCFQAHLILSAN